MVKVIRNSLLVVCGSVLLFLAIFTVPVLAVNKRLDFNVIVDPGLNVTLSSNNVVIDLNPNSKTYGSKSIDVAVKTNASAGYQLLMSTADDTTTLDRDDSADSVAANLPTLPVVTGGYTDSAFATCSTSNCMNKWGYKIDSGNFNGFTSGDVILENTTMTAEDTANLTFAAKIDYNKPAGDYAKTLIFTAIANALPVTYMQDFTYDMCKSLAFNNPYTVVDARDDEEYTVRYYSGNCWMTKNLKFTGTTLDSTTSNVPATYTEASPLTLTYGNLATDAGSYNNPAIATGTDSNGSDTVWYNYAAASAGTITGASNTDTANYSVCPAGWKLPSLADVSGMYSYDIRQSAFKFKYEPGVVVTVDDWHYPKLAKLENLFGTTVGGVWSNNNLLYSGNASGFWLNTYGDDNNARTMVAAMKEDYDWCANPGSAEYCAENGISDFPVIQQYIYDYNSTDENPIGDRQQGLYVRCVIDDTRTLNDATYLQDISPQMLDRTAAGATANLRDSRDNQLYTVKKLLGGNLWITDNLNLGAEPLLSDLTPYNTNLNYDNPVTAAEFSSWKKTAGSGDRNPAYIEVSGTDSVSGSKYGVLYNYPAMTVNQWDDYNIDTATILNDVCPLGWSVPRGSSELMDLYTYGYTSLASMRAPLASGGAAFAVPGYFDTGAPINKDTEAYYWADDAMGEDILHIDVTNNLVEVDQHMNMRTHGASVRCLARWLNSDRVRALLIN